MPKEKLSAHFSKSEFACKCGCGFDTPDPLLIVGLEALRSAIGRSITISSGCRCSAHNKSVGGASRSLHVAAKAADIKARGMTSRQLYAKARKIPELRGFGVADRSDFLHVDAREYPARWCYLNGRHSAWVEA